jgi:hypothetical protein
MVRVLKPGGLLVVSMPFGRTYMEQTRIGFAGASTKTGDTREYFFQRIFDRRAFQTRILDALGDLERVSVTTVTRRNLWLAGTYGKTGENVRGLLGFLNPLIATTTSQTRAGVDDDFPVAYGRMHSAADVYGDLILSGTKRLSPPAHG